MMNRNGIRSTRTGTMAVLATLLWCALMLFFTKVEEQRLSVPVRTEAGSGPSDGPDPSCLLPPGGEKGSGPFSAAEKGPDPLREVTPVEQPAATAAEVPEAIAEKVGPGTHLAIRVQDAPGATPPGLWVEVWGDWQVVAQGSFLCEPLAHPVGPTGELCFPDLLARNLEKGRAVLLTVLDGAGRRFAGVPHVSASIPDASGDPLAVVTANGSEPGLFRFTDLPSGGVRFEALVAGRNYHVIHDTLVPEAQLVVPRHGALRVCWELQQGTGPVGLCLFPQGKTDKDLKHYLGREMQPAGQCRLPAVLPGVYRARLTIATGSAPLELEEPVAIHPDATAEVAFRR